MAITVVIAAVAEITIVAAIIIAAEDAIITVAEVAESI